MLRSSGIDRLVQFRRRRMAVSDRVILELQDVASVFTNSVGESSLDLLNSNNTGKITFVQQRPRAPVGKLFFKLPDDVEGDIVGRFAGMPLETDNALSRRAQEYFSEGGCILAFPNQNC